jgi:nitroreductase
MDLFEAIEKRHCYRGTFTDAPVPRGDLERIVRAGIRAPSGCNEQTTSFVIVVDPELRTGMAEILQKETVRTAPAIVVCVADPREVFKGMSFYKEDCAAAVENMLLAMTALGYRSVWLDGVLRRDGVAERIGELLGIPDGRQVQVLLPLGVPADEVTATDRKPFGERAWFDRWGG